MSYHRNSSRSCCCFGLSASVRLGVAAVAACFFAGNVLSNPVNPAVVNGAATFNQVGNVLTVTNSNGAIINWDKFSIKAGETARFEQTSASSSVLNRVLLNDPTTIYGTLSSNGRVWLVNPAGIMVGAGGRVDVAGFVASTLNITNADFLAGRHLFINDGAARDVVNQGSITTPAGGSVYLIGSNVSNEGIITTPQGETILAAGNTVSLIDSATPGVKVDVTGAEGNATNLGTITAEAGRIGIAGALVRNSGILNASSVSSEGGRIFLRATKKIELADTSIVGADGTVGGNVTAIVSENGKISGDLVAGGEISAQGNGTKGSGGFVETSAKTADINSVRVNTRGGTWLLDPDDVEIGGTATIAGATLVTPTTIQNALVNNDFVVQTNASGSGGNGDIVVNSALSWSSIHSLELDAMRDITVNQPITNAGSGGVALLAQRDIALNNGISSNGGTITVVAGWDGTSLASSPTLAAVAPATGNGGSIILDNGNLSTSGTVNLSATGDIAPTQAWFLSTADDYQTMNSGILAATLNTHSGGNTTLLGYNSIGTLTVNNPTGGYIDFNTAGDLVLGPVTGSNISISADGNLAVNSTLLATTGVSLFSGGSISGSGTVSTPGLLQTFSVTGTSLTHANTVAEYRGSNMTSGNIVLNNAAGNLVIDSMFNSATGGNNIVTNTGNITVSDQWNGISASTYGSVSLTATNGGITVGQAGSAGLFNTLIGAGGGVALATAGTGGSIAVYGDIFASDNVTMTAVGSSSDVGVYGNIGVATPSLRSLTLRADRSVIIDGTSAYGGRSALTARGSGPLDIVVNADRDGNGNGGIVVRNADLASYADGDLRYSAVNAGITLGGGANPLTGMAYGNPGVLLDNANLAAGLGSIQIRGSGTAGGAGIASINGGSISGSGLTTASSGGTILNGANQVFNFAATNSGSGDISLVNTSAPSVLTISGIINTGNAGNIVVDNTGGIVTSGLISAVYGAVALTAHSPITVNAGINAGGGNISLSASTGITLASTASLNAPSGSIRANTQAGDITVAGGASVSVGPSGGTIAFSASGGGRVVLDPNAVFGVTPTTNFIPLPTSSVPVDGNLAVALNTAVASVDPANWSMVFDQTESSEPAAEASGESGNGDFHIGRRNGKPILGKPAK